MDETYPTTARSAARMRRGTHTVTIGGGEWRGRVLRYPSGGRTRPSMQRTKASMFSSLAPWLDGAVFADLYAGAGAVGIEALSRGARYVHFVECDRAAVEALRENLDRLAVDAARFRVHERVVAQVLEARPCPIADAAVVFADAPYDDEVGDELSARLVLEAMPALSRLVIEHRTRASIPAPAGMIVERRRRFGDTTLSYFARASA